MATMTIRQCMDAALQLLNQYSIAGSLVPSTYNDQQDDENRMINLINDAQMTLATTVRPIDAHFTYTIPEPDKDSLPSEVLIEMPEDFHSMVGLYFEESNGRGSRTIDANKYKWLSDHMLLLPDRPAGKYTVMYSRFPIRYTEATDKNTTLDNLPDTHEAIPYFVAAMISVDDNPRAYFALYNIWETRVARMGYKPAHAVATQVDDVYGFGNFC